MSGLPGTPGFPGFDGPKGQIQCLKYCILKPTQPFNILESVFFFIVFERSRLCSPRLHLFDRKYKKKVNIVKYYTNLK